MPQKHYNIIFMRDDAHVRRFRIRPMVFTLTLYSAGCLLVLALVAIWATIHLWGDNDDLQQEVAGCKSQIHEQAVELERLRNMEKILKASGIEAPDAPDPANAAPQAGGLDLAALMAETNTGQAAIRNVALRQGDAAWRLIFELSNADHKQPLEGAYSIQVLTRDGAFHDVQVEKEATQFAIQRFKKAEVEFTLPVTLPRDAVFGLRLSIVLADGKVIYRKTWQLSSIPAAS